MQRLPERQYAVRGPAHSRARRRSHALLVSWLLPLGAVGSLACAGLVVLGLGLVQKPAPHPAPKATHAPQAASVLGDGSLTQQTQFTFRHPSVAPLTPKPVAASARPKAPATPPATAATPSASPTVPGTSAGTPPPTAEYETPRGADQLAWSEAILSALGAPATGANIISIGYWMQNEAGTAPYGIVGANNPINVSESGYGCSPIQYEAPGYSLCSYPSPQAGVQAIVAYLNSGSYPLILAALKAGAGLSSSSLAGELAEYSGNGYTTIPDGWGASQGTPQT